VTPVEPLPRTPALGALRDRVQILRRDVADDGQGGTTTTFVLIATVWGRVRELTARPARGWDRRIASISHSVVLRFRTDISPGDRLLYRGRALDVVAADDLNGRRAYLSCACLEEEGT
jgi:SPP1 family predicted phage head-tail adaptor